MKKSRRTYNGVHLNKKSNTQDVVEQSLTLYHNETCCATRCKKWNYYTKNRIHYDTDRQGDIPDDAPSDNGTV